MNQQQGADQTVLWIIVGILLFVFLPTVFAVIVGIFLVFLAIKVIPVLFTVLLIAFVRNKK